MDLKSLETNNPLTGGNGWVIFGLIVFFVGILGSEGFFFKEKIIRYRVTWIDKIKSVEKKIFILKHLGAIGGSCFVLLASHLTGKYVHGSHF